MNIAKINININKMLSSHLYMLNKSNKIYPQLLENNTELSDTDSISSNSSDTLDSLNFKNKKVQIPETIKFTGGYTSNLTRNTPFIDFLIKKRIASCKLGPSTHIAAFIPELGKKQYLIRPNRKDRYW
jgi:hypothetical protein